MDRKPRILVIGSINMDLVMNMERVPEAGETVMGISYTYIPGGKGANQAVAAARIGGDVTFCGSVGADVNGKVMLKNLSDNKINVSYIKEDKNIESGLAAIPVDATGENRIAVFTGANGKVAREDVDKALEKDYDAIMMQLEITLDTVYYAFEKAKEKGIPVILDTGPAIKIDLSRFKDIDVISPNEHEASILTGIDVDSEESAIKAAKYLQEKTNAKYVLIKLGSRGAMLYTYGKHEFFPAFKVKAIDSTAAGDSFTAATTVKMLEYDGDMKKAIIYANAVGALCVSKTGAQPSLPTAEEVSAFLIERNV